MNGEVERVSAREVDGEGDGGVDRGVGGQEEREGKLGRLGSGERWERGGEGVGVGVRVRGGWGGHVGGGGDFVWSEGEVQ